MTYDPNKHHRRSIRLKGYDYTQPGSYFVTIVTHQRQLLFGDILNGDMFLNNVGCIVKAEWLRTADIRDNVTLDEFVSMPNHLHSIIIINDDEIPVGASRSSPLQTDMQLSHGPVPHSLGAIMAGFKSSVTKRINGLRNTPGMPVWQRNYYEHIIRNEMEWNNIRKYILTNPKKWETDQENPNAQPP
jgi:REP element-mobilizing transposase RayT